MTTTKHLVPILLLAVLLGGLLIGAFVFRAQNAVGSVAVSNEYHATTTGAFQGMSAISVIKEGNGAFGSVVITSTNTGSMTFYDATTTNITKRTGNVATSSILLAEFQASPTVGTYTFDVNFDAGLLLVVQANRPTSTVTFR